MKCTRALAVMGAAALLGSLALAGGPSALASSGNVDKEGNCSARSDWRLKASPDDGRIRVEGEVDSNVGGQRWRWKILHNGQVSARGSKQTESGSGSFRVRRLLVNAEGTDRIGWRAKNPNTGETCRGSVRF